MILRRRKPMRIVRPSDVIKCEGHKKWVRGFECVVIKNAECLSPMHAHHVSSVGAGGGDNQVVPLCAKHHKEIHDIGRNTFAEKHNVDLEQLASFLWLKSPHGMKYRASMKSISTKENYK